jgi:serine/threonine protein kinase
MTGSGEKVENLSLNCPSCSRVNQLNAKFCSKCGMEMSMVKTRKISLLDNRYQIVHEIKSGSMGCVYKAFDVRLGSIVALKKMVALFKNTDDKYNMMVRFRREAKILSELNHPGLPSVTDFFISDDGGGKTAHYLVMSFIDGKDLETVVNEQGRTPLPVNMVLDYFRQILEILNYLHTYNPPIIYRDVKPSNVMVRDKNVFLIDFGIAKVFESQVRGTAIGTPGYAPPEQYKGFARQESDLYSTGAMVHYLLTGISPDDENRPPFSFDPVKAINPSIPEYLDNLVMSMLEMNINNRPESAAEVLKILDKNSSVSADQGLPGNQPEKSGVPAFDQYQELFEAIEKDDVETVSSLTEQGADLNTKDPKGGWCCLHKAASRGNRKMVELLLRNGASIGAKTDSGATALLIAARGGFIEVMKELVKHGADVNSHDEFISSAIHYAAERGDGDMVSLLLNSDAKVNAKRIDYETPLHRALYTGNESLSTDVVSILVRNNANVKARNDSGYTPLHCAAELGYINIAEILLNYEAVIDARQLDGLTPVNIAMDNNHLEFASFLIENGADTSVLSEDEMKMIEKFREENPHPAEPSSDEEVDEQACENLKSPENSASLAESAPVDPVSTETVEKEPEDVPSGNSISILSKISGFFKKLTGKKQPEN